MLYCPWDGTRRTLVTREEFRSDLEVNRQKIVRFGVKPADLCYFLPPYEHCNRDIATWTGELGMMLINYTPGPRSNADGYNPWVDAVCHSFDGRTADGPLPAGDTSTPRRLARCGRPIEVPPHRQQRDGPNAARLSDGPATQRRKNKRNAPFADRVQ